MWIRKYIVSLFIFLLCLSCEDWLDVNHDPNNPSEEQVNYESLLSSGISSIAYVVGGRYQVLGALWSQHWTQSLGATQYAGIDAYDINSSSFDDRQFGELYSGALKSLEYVKLESEKEQEWNYFLIATVLQAYTFQILADLYDEIPFSDALQGETGNHTPVYEKGQDVYDSLIVRIDNALSKDLDKNGLKDPGISDLIFSGDMDKWIEFANTLKLKIYLRQSEARPSIAQHGIELLFENEVDFLSADASMNYFEDISGSRNPLYETEISVLGGNPNLILSRTLHSFLQANGDFDRLDRMFYTPDNGGPHKSLVQGNYNDPEEPAGTNSSSYSKPILFAVSPVYLMSSSEVGFMKAEAVLRYNVGSYSDAKENYDQAIIDAFDRVLSIDPFLSDEDIIERAETFVNGLYRLPAEGSSIENYVEAIILQKWVALAGIQSLETFFEQNRTGYPQISDVLPDENDYEPGYLTISVNNVTSGRFPKRLIFPESEVSGNPNTPEAKPVWEKIWWDTENE
jgi:hypothetical protein